MFTTCYKKTKEIPYIRHPSYENLFVLPYINCRLVFAELAVRAITEGQFDLIAIDLPYFMKTKKWLDIPIDSFPFPSSLIIKNANDNFKTFNFVPNDAACISAYQVRRLQGAGSAIEFECLDDWNIINYPEAYFKEPVMELVDDYFALTDGVESYFSGVYKKINRFWETFSVEQKLYWNYRATIVANRLDKCLKSGKKTLFVCNYKLWWLVNTKLKSGNFENKNIVFMPWKNQKALLLFQNPCFLWIKGVLDDYPAVVFRFFSKLDHSNSNSFDKINALNEIISDVVDEMKAKKNENVSIRKLMVFRQYLRIRLGIHCRITPTLPGYLHDAAVSCLGKSFARNILDKLFEYPLADENFAQFLEITYDNVTVSGEGFELPDEFHETFLNSGFTTDGGVSFGDCHNDELQREKLAAQVRPFIKKYESKYLRGHKGTIWALKQEYLIHAQANRLVRQIADKTSREYRSIKSWGSTGDGIDWKATIRSKATGDDAIYVKRSKKCEFEKLNLNAFVPTVFILQDTTGGGNLNSVHDSNITQRYIDLKKEELITQDFPDPDYVYSIFSLKTNVGLMCDRHIMKESVLAILFLCTHPWMGPERYKRIIARSERFHCRVEPDEDEELRSFAYPDRLVVCGVKYAEKVVVVVSEDSWKPAPETLNFAKQKNVRIVRIALSSFSQEFINRLKHMHFISTPLKKHPHQEDIVQRYIPDIFEP